VPHYSSLQLFGYAAAAVWAAGNLFLGIWGAILSFKMENHRMPNKPARGGRRFAFQRDASDYTEAGQMYRCKAIRVELALFAWAFGVIGLIGIVTGGK
jgi:hypothetical protein